MGGLRCVTPSKDIWRCDNPKNPWNSIIRKKTTDKVIRASWLKWNGRNDKSKISFKRWQTYLAVGCDYGLRYFDTSWGEYSTSSTEVLRGVDHENWLENCWVSRVGWSVDGLCRWNQIAIAIINWLFWCWHCWD